MSKCAYNTVENYFSVLKVSPGSIHLNQLHKMCLVPILNDIVSGKMFEFASKDKSFWEEFFFNCFPEFGFSSPCESN